MTHPKILAFAGSTRTDSFNKKLVKIAANIAEEQGLEVTHLDLRDLPMPIYDGDLEENEGIPDNGMKFRKLLKEHQGFLISAPEYNSSISGVLKNAIDWASRPIPNEESLICFKNKIVSLLSASPGALGGLRGLVHVRAILGNIGSIVLPHQYALSKAHETFDPDGTLKDKKTLTTIEQQIKMFIEVLRRLA